MHRLALLLASVGLASGCVVESTSSTCGSGYLTVDWSFLNSAGNTAYCGSGLSQTINNGVDVYVDGVWEDTVTCTAYGVALPSLYSAGVHDVMVEAFNGSYVIARDIFTVDVCDDTAVTAYPGEGILDIQPTNCDVSTDALTYSISDVTAGLNQVVWSQIPPDTLTSTCGGGIQVYVPFGNFNLDGIEETNFNGSTIYRTHCSSVATDVPTFGTHTYNVAFDDVYAFCF